MQNLILTKVESTCVLFCCCIICVPKNVLRKLSVLGKIHIRAYLSYLFLHTILYYDWVFPIIIFYSSASNYTFHAYCSNYTNYSLISATYAIVCYYDIILFRKKYIIVRFRKANYDILNDTLQATTCKKL